MGNKSVEFEELIVSRFDDRLDDVQTRQEELSREVGDLRKKQSEQIRNNIDISKDFNR